MGSDDAIVIAVVQAVRFATTIIEEIAFWGGWAGVLNDVSKPSTSPTTHS